MMRIPPGDASRNLFPPEALVVHVDTHRHNERLVTYTYLIDYVEEPAS